ncbi:MAG: hypothetical protein HYS22_09020 [Deltaproteobacteria bacterium]|nr:hypothetical protein [Deltaproteobacteria bacterium]
MGRSPLIVLVLLLMVPLVVGASMVVPLNVEKLTARAGKIFVGRCEEVREDLDENRMAVTYVTYRVLERIKGDLRDLETIKIFGVSKKRVLTDDGLTGSPSTVVMRSDETAYQKGKEEILFLYPESSLGLTSPVGLGQGRLSISTLPNGKRVVRGQYGSRFLLRHSSSSTLKTLTLSGDAENLELDGFLSAVKRMVNR